MSLQVEYPCAILYKQGKQFNNVWITINQMITLKRINKVWNATDANGFRMVTIEMKHAFAFMQGMTCLDVEHEPSEYRETITGNIELFYLNHRLRKFNVLGPEKRMSEYEDFKSVLADEDFVYSLLGVTVLAGLLVGIMFAGLDVVQHIINVHPTFPPSATNRKSGEKLELVTCGDACIENITCLVCGVKAERVYNMKDPEIMIDGRYI